MKEASIGAMLLLGGANYRYATGMYGVPYVTGVSYAIVPYQGEPIVFGHGTPVIQDRRQVTWVKSENIRYAILAAIGMMASGLWLDPGACEYQLKKLGEQIKATLEEMKLSKEVLYLDVNDGGVISILERLGVKTSVAADLPVRAMEIKTKDEIECLRMAAAMGDVVMYEVAKYAEPGKTESEISGYMAYIGSKLGAEYIYLPGCMSGPHGWPNFRNTTDRFLRPGDIFFCDISHMPWNGYLTCYYRTFSCLTKPSQKPNDAYKKIEDWLYGALEDCKPGNTTADMVKHFPDEKKYWGLDPDYTWGDNLMHGIGLVMYGPPSDY